MYPPFNKAYEKWVPVVARVILGAAFLHSAVWKIPGTEMFAMQVATTAATWWPLATFSVFLAFILETVGGIALIIGWKTRLFSFLLAGFVAILTIVFHWPDFSDPMSIGAFTNHLIFIAALLYVSVYGAKHVALKRD